MNLARFETIVQTIRTRTGFDELSLRERFILLAGGIFVVGVLCFQFIISPYFEARTTLKNSIRKHERDLVDIRLLSQEFSELRVEEGGIKAHLAQRSKGFTLFTFIDQQAEAAGVKPQINYMKPSEIEMEGELNESIVELKLQEVTLEKLVKFMQLTESEINVVSIRRISIQVSANKQGYLDVILQIVTFVEAG